MYVVLLKNDDQSLCMKCCHFYKRAPRENPDPIFRKHTLGDLSVLTEWKPNDKCNHFLKSYILRTIYQINHSVEYSCL